MKQSTVERKAKEIYVNTFGMIPDDRDLQPFLEMAQWSEQQTLRKVMEMIPRMCAKYGFPDKSSREFYDKEDILQTLSTLMKDELPK